MSIIYSLIGKRVVFKELKRILFVLLFCNCIYDDSLNARFLVSLFGSLLGENFHSTCFFCFCFFFCLQHVVAVVAYIILSSFIYIHTHSYEQRHQLTQLLTHTTYTTLGIKTKIFRTITGKQQQLQ